MNVKIFLKYLANLFRELSSVMFAFLFVYFFFSSKLLATLCLLGMLLSIEKLSKKKFLNFRFCAAFCCASFLIKNVLLGIIIFLIYVFSSLLQIFLRKKENLLRSIVIFAFLIALFLV